MLGEGICCPGNACFAPMRRLDARGLWRVRAPPAPDLPAGMRGDARYMMCAMRISATWWRHGAAQVETFWPPGASGARALGCLASLRLHTRVHGCTWMRRGDARRGRGYERCTWTHAWMPGVFCAHGRTRTAAHGCGGEAPGSRGGRLPNAPGSRRRATTIRRGETPRTLCDPWRTRAEHAM